MVIVFARRPRAGRVKRRLAHAVGRRRAAALYARTLARTLAMVAALRGVRRELRVADGRDLAWFARLRRAGWQVGAQRGRDLGARMAAALAVPLAQGAPVLLLGSDLRDVTAADLVRARDALVAGVEVVFGAAADGGYWLVGLRRPCPELFEAMTWSTPRVLATSLARARAAGRTVEVLSPRRDLDHGRDLLRGAPPARMPRT